MTKEEHFQAALKMIQVTPDNYKSLTSEMILHVCRVVVDAKKLCEASDYAGLTAEQIQEKISL